MSLPIDQFVVPKGSTVLITGVNGFIGSNIADQFLTFGFKVRGTTRSLEKNAWVSTLFNKKYGPGNFELVAVPDMVAQDAFIEAAKGVSAIVHTASIFTMDPNPHNVIPGTVSGTVNALKAAAQEPSVKRFVLTSSSTAALIPKPNNPIKVTTDTWNDEAVELAYRDPPYEPERAGPVYGASKTLSEKEAWKFMDEKKPGFTLNTILPNINFGASLDFASQGHPTTSGILAEIFKGNANYLAFIPPQYYVDVQDDALLHVAAVVHPGVQSERIFAFAEPVNGDRILAILRKLYPNRSFPSSFKADEDLSDIVPRKRAEALLREMGRDGWTSMEESIKRNTEDIV
ncbi:putative aldehyde reductase protein [Eutypa lata UCREL1]|uniref:Putative aldehyde reductase protein n=1 Tax=Eutypa lata (strain UCR-EL1) TaxID=1287681 RepID=M7THG9_EUTLA|nr:putative aldehyde reductase protein [Eutypa lata UCREL1]